jgi:hypothetical protein
MKSYQQIVTIGYLLENINKKKLNEEKWIEKLGMRIS